MKKQKQRTLLQLRPNEKRLKKIDQIAEKLGLKRTQVLNMLIDNFTEIQVKIDKI